MEDQQPWLARFKILLSQISSGNDKKKNNYTLEKIDLAGHLSFDLLTLDEKIIAFCGVYSGGRFPPGAFRILNRCYVVPEFRTKKLGRFADLNSKHLLNHQLQEHAAEIQFPFVSREGPDGEKFLRQWASQNAPTDDWVVSEDMIHVVPKSTDASAFQFICYRQPQKHLQLFDRISANEWKSRYGTP